MFKRLLHFRLQESTVAFLLNSLSYFFLLLVLFPLSVLTSLKVHCCRAGEVGYEMLSWLQALWWQAAFHLSNSPWLFHAGLPSAPHSGCAGRDATSEDAGCSVPAQPCQHSALPERCAQGRDWKCTWTRLPKGKPGLLVLWLCKAVSWIWASGFVITWLTTIRMCLYICLEGKICVSSRI